MLVLDLLNSDSYSFDRNVLGKDLSNHWKCFKCGKNDNHRMFDEYCKNEECGLGINPYYYFVKNDKSEKIVREYPLFKKEFGIIKSDKSDRTKKYKKDDGYLEYDQFILHLNEECLEFICLNATKDDLKAIALEWGYYIFKFEKAGMNGFCSEFDFKSHHQIEITKRKYLGLPEIVLSHIPMMDIIHYDCTYTNDRKVHSEFEHFWQFDRPIKPIHLDFSKFRKISWPSLVVNGERGSDDVTWSFVAAMENGKVKCANNDNKLVQECWDAKISTNKKRYHRKMTKYMKPILNIVENQGSNINLAKLNDLKENCNEMKMLDKILHLSDKQYLGIFDLLVNHDFKNDKNKFWKTDRNFFNQIYFKINNELGINWKIDDFATSKIPNELKQTDCGKKLEILKNSFAKHAKIEITRTNACGLIKMIICCQLILESKNQGISDENEIARITAAQLDKMLHQKE